MNYARPDTNLLTQGPRRLRRVAVPLAESSSISSRTICIVVAVVVVCLTIATYIIVTSWSSGNVVTRLEKLKEQIATATKKLAAIRNAYNEQQWADWSAVLLRGTQEERKEILEPMEKKKSDIAKLESEMAVTYETMSKALEDADSAVEALLLATKDNRCVFIRQFAAELKDAFDLTKEKVTSVTKDGPTVKDSRARLMAACTEFLTHSPLPLSIPIPAVANMDEKTKTVLDEASSAVNIAIRIAKQLVRV